MTGEELRAEVDRRKTAGHAHTFLVVPYRGRVRSPLQRVRVMPGVMGRVVGESEPGLVVVDVEVAAIERALDRAGVPRVEGDKQGDGEITTPDRPRAGGSRTP
jgi:hypothetical protein